MKTTIYYQTLTINEKINYRTDMKRNGFTFDRPMVVVFAVISYFNNL